MKYFFFFFITNCDGYWERNLFCSIQTCHIVSGISFVTYHSSLHFLKKSFLSVHIFRALEKLPWKRLKKKRKNLWNITIGRMLISVDFQKTKKKKKNYQREVRIEVGWGFYDVMNADGHEWEDFSHQTLWESLGVSHKSISIQKLWHNLLLVIKK